jgi:hypothetical protein
VAYIFVFSLLQDNLEVHYSGFKTNHIHNLSDLVQGNLGAQVCQIFICIPICIIDCSNNCAASNCYFDFFPFLYMSPGKKVWLAEAI